MRTTEADRNRESAVGRVVGPGRAAGVAVGVPVFDRTRAPLGIWPSLCGYTVRG